MDSDKYSSSIELICSTCGCTKFQNNELENARIHCAGCGRTFSKDELICENEEGIQAEVDKVKSDLLADFKSQLKRQFKNSKYIKIK